MQNLVRKVKNKIFYGNPGHADYSENTGGKYTRLTSDEYRERLCSWQVPAIIKHLGSLDNSNFIDIGAGDIVLGEKQDQIGRPKKYFVLDLSEPSLRAGLDRLKSKNIDISNIETIVSIDFDFSSIEDEFLDYAFSNSFFSHLSINSIILCLRNLRPKMKQGARYFSSMIIVPETHKAKPHDWSYLNTTGSAVTSYPQKDPFHYDEKNIKIIIQECTDFKIIAIHDYGHAFQKLVEFQAV